MKLLCSDEETAKKATKEVNSQANIDHFLPKKRKHVSSSCELYHKLFVEVMEGCDSKDKELMKFVKSKLTEIQTESLKRSSSTSTSNIVDKQHLIQLNPKNLSNHRLIAKKLYAV